MITDKQLRFATANLLNFIEPPDAYYDFENIYESDAWREKCQWTKNQFISLDADIIGVQEVFSIAAMRRLFEEIGYPYFASVGQPHVEDDYIYSQPVVAVASKYPIIHIAPVMPLAEIQDSYQTTVPEFSRSPIHAVIDVPSIGEVAVYVCHLKSQRATESTEIDNSQQPSQLNHQLIGRWLSSQQRGWEALLLRSYMEQQYQRHPMPTVLMGDMNQGLSSDITGLLTSDSGHNGERLQLQDSWDIYSKDQEGLQRPATHYYFAKGNVLDYILLSQEFQPDSHFSMADISDFQVIDQHLIDPLYERDKYASDHAFVAVTVRFVL